MAPSFYDILGVSRNATDEEVRRAYKRAALRVHPDRRNINANPVDDDQDPGEEFKKVNEAYTVLSDPENRKLYDFHGVWPVPDEEEPSPAPQAPRFMPKRARGAPRREKEDGGGPGFYTTNAFGRTVFVAPLPVDTPWPFLSSQFPPNYVPMNPINNPPPFPSKMFFGNHFYDPNFDSPDYGWGGGPDSRRREGHTGHPHFEAPEYPGRPSRASMDDPIRSNPWKDGDDRHDRPDGYPTPERAGIDPRIFMQHQPLPHQRPEPIWIKETYITTTENGRVQTEWYRLDINQNEHVARFYDDGRPSEYHINGILQNYLPPLPSGSPHLIDRERDRGRHNRRDPWQRQHRSHSFAEPRRRGTPYPGEDDILPPPLDQWNPAADMSRPPLYTPAPAPYPPLYATPRPMAGPPPVPPPLPPFPLFTDDSMHFHDNHRRDSKKKWWQKT
ncbi:hypothetical protein BS47DRAFT_1339054 [Hydnum rufescens UP504]|uniref:J domain-containing protein n=1 Tax=Hydnum rufescens UP504 TaxID=1448309 RepID=A0A9P6B5E8_9AGAM|nr:hypothetical protein BS47DRAFT_1339054 [Hydnum rufescens UP504]